MTYEQAVEKAKENKGHAIDIMDYETAVGLVGKTLTSKEPGNKNRIEVVENVNGNYIIRLNGEKYNTTPVAWALQNLRRMNVEG